MRLKEIRREKGMTQEELAEALEVELRTIQYWESSVPPIKDLLKLSAYFKVHPRIFLDENEKIPEYKLGKTGTINREKLREEVLVSIKNLSYNNVIHDVYRHIYIEYTDGMKEELLDIALSLTDIYSRLVVMLSSKEWKNLLPLDGFLNTGDYETDLDLLAMDLFSSENGIFHIAELDAVIDQMCTVCSKYYPFACLLPSRIGGYLLHLYKSNAYVIIRAQQYFICEQIFLELLSFVGKKVN